MSDLSHQGAFRLIYEPNRTVAEQAALQSHLRTCAECRQDAHMAGIFNDHLVLKSLPTRPSVQFTADYKESVARRSRRSHIMKPIYAVGGLAALALLMLAGWFVIRSNIQTTGLLGAPELPPMSVSEPQATALPAVAVESEAQPDTNQQEIDMTLLDENLVAAITANDAAEVARFLEAGANPNFVAGNGDVPLPLAAGAGDLEIVKLLLDAGADVNSTMDGKISTGHTVYEATPLFHAAAAGHLDVVEMLLTNGADPNKTETALGVAPLHEAARMNYVEIVQVLIEHGASLSIEDNEGQTALDVATGDSRDLLREAGAASGSPAETSALEEGLDAAIEEGDTAEVERILEDGANPNFVNDEGDMPLALATMTGNLEIVQMLLDAGADVNSTASEQYPAGQSLTNATAIAHAAYGRYYDLVALLIEHGADVNRPQANSQETALHNAVWRSSPEIVKLLLDNGADPDLPVNNSWFPEGATALHYAIGNGSLSSAQALLEGGADANIITSNGQVPLMFVMSQQFSTEQTINFITALLKAGADPNKQDPNGDTALHYAIRSSQNNLIPLLVENGAAVDRQNGEGDTPLHLAARTNRAEAVSILIDQGASVSIENNAGETPLNVAANDAIKEMLREAGASE